MDSSNTDDQSKGPNPPPQIELANNGVPHVPPPGQTYTGYPTSMQTTVIPPVSAPGSAYSSHQPMQAPASPYMSGNHNHHNPTASAVYPPAHHYPYGYPPAGYPMVGCPYPTQTPNTPYSGTITTTTPANPPPPGAPSYATQFPYPPPQSFADPTVPPYVPGAATATYTSPHTPSHHASSYIPQSAYPPTQIPAYPPSTSHHYPPVSAAYPPQTPNQPPMVPHTPALIHSPTHQAIGMVPPSIGMTAEASAAADARHHQGAPSKRVELGNPTVKPAPNFNPQTDAEELREAFKLSSPNKDVLINILCHRSLEQRFIIANNYNELTSETLVGEIKTKFDCNFQKIMLALLTPLIDFYVQELNESLENYDHDSTIDIMCPLSNYEMYTLKYVYQKKYGIPLETEVRSKTSEHLKRLLLAICACSRDETGITNLAAAQYDARQLALQENPYDDEQFCYYKDIFSTRNFQQIKLISEEYQKITGQALEKTIKSKFIMDDKQGYLCIVRYSQDKHGFFAKRLHRSMAGMGTNDNQLIRLVVTRCEIDLQDIKDTFQRNFGKSLRSWIKGDTSGHYKYCLYELIGEKRSNKYGICCKCC